MTLRPALVLPFLLLLTACAGTARVATTAPAPAPESARPKALVRDDIIIVAQPTAEDLAAWRADGVRSVFNVRTPAEMADRKVVPFDEAALAAELGYAYAEHGIAGSQGYRPEILDAFAAAVAAGDGPVLLHCGTGARAGLLYAAYAVKYLGRSPDEAMRDLEPLGLWPLPLERLTGLPLRLESIEQP
ncbi:MAG: hypothetical protein KF823_11175 [Xanthomonadales bacterium]|nr:hypothetical protein [Xanthomonadales bacterium]